MNRLEFDAAVRAIATANLQEQNVELTPEAIERQMRWPAALHEAEGMAECSVKDFARSLVNGGIPATDYDEWADSLIEDECEGEALDQLETY